MCGGRGAASGGQREVGDGKRAKSTADTIIRLLPVTVNMGMYLNTNPILEKYLEKIQYKD